MRLTWPPHWITALLVAVALLATPAMAQQQEQGAQAAIERLVQRIEDPDRRAELLAELQALLDAQAAAEPGPAAASATSGLGGRLIEATSNQMERISQQVAGAGRAFLAVPGLARDMAQQATDAETRRRWMEMAGKVVLVLAVGLLAEWLARWILRRGRLAIDERAGGGLGLRALFLLLRTVLDGLPILAFAAATYGLLPLLEPHYVTRLVALTLINANVLIRLTLLVSRLILVPQQPALRLLPMGDETVAYLYVWLRRLLRLSIYGYFVLEAALLLGMPAPAHEFLLKLLGLIVAGMVIVVIMQNRRSVSAAIAGSGPAPEPASEEEPAVSAVEKRLRVPPAVRQRLGALWHLAALALVVALYGVWALEIPGGFGFLSQAIGLTLISLAVAMGVSRAAQQGISRLFRISEELRQAHPGLEARANRYLPALRTTLKAIIWIFAASAVLQAWGLGTLDWLFSDSGSLVLGKLISILLIVVATFAIWELTSGLIERALARRTAAEPGASTRLLTLLPLLRNVVRIGLGLISVMIIFSELGVNIGPLLAGAGVIGLAVGFGAQTLVRDVITGAFILIEDAISVGDVVTAGGYTGTVESISIRTVRMRDLHGTLHMVPFGEVTTVLNYSREFAYALVDAGVAYRENYGEVVQILQEVAAELRADPDWAHDIVGDLEVFGLNNLADSAVEIRVRLMTRPGRQWGVRREFLRRMKEAFDARGIEIPFPHRTLWFGVDKDGTAPPARVLSPRAPAAGEPERSTESASLADRPSADAPTDTGEPSGPARGET